MRVTDRGGDAGLRGETSTMAQETTAEQAIALEEACELLWLNRRELLHARAEAMREDGRSEEQILDAVNRLSERLWAAAQHVLAQRKKELGDSRHEAALSLHREGFFEERDLLQIMGVDRWELERMLNEQAASDDE